MPLILDLLLNIYDELVAAAAEFCEVLCGGRG